VRRRSWRRSPAAGRRLLGAEGLTPAQAADVLGISAANFRMRLSAARRALDKSLKAAENDRRSAALLRTAPHQTEVRA
jgi:hypothetical protein